MPDNQVVTRELKEQFLAEYVLGPHRPDLSEARVIVHVAQDGLTISKVAVRLRLGQAGKGAVRVYDVAAL